MSGRIPLFRIAGIQVNANWSWLIIVVLISLSLAGGFYPAALPGRLPSTYWLLGLLTALLFFASLLTHELAHSLVARRYGLPVREILLFVFGGVSNIEREAHEPRVEFRVAIVGPLTSFAIAALAWGLARVSSGAPRVVFGYLVVVNLFVGVFNLLPGFPLDGGRVLRAWLWHRWRDAARATRVAASIGSGFGWALIILGALQALGGGLAGGLWIALIGMFLQAAASSSAQQVALREQLVGLRVSDVMTPEASLVTVSPDLTVDRFVDEYLWRERYDGFPVLGAGRAFLGLVGIEQVRAVPREAWRTTRVEAIMRPAAEVPTVSAGEDAVRALERMMSTGEGRLPVVRGNHAGQAELAGIVTRRDILHLLRLRTDLGAGRPDGLPAAPPPAPVEPAGGRA